MEAMQIVMVTSFAVMLTGLMIQFRRPTVGMALVTTGALGYLFKNVWENDVTWTLIWLAIVLIDASMTAVNASVWGLGKGNTSDSS